MNAPNPMADPLTGPDVEFGAELTRNGFLDGRFELLQPKKGLRAGSDAMFLAAAVPASAGDTIIEAGLGTGAAALALLVRVAETRVLGVESHPPHAALARANADLNAMSGRLVVVEGGIVSIPGGALAGGGLAPPFDHAMANPPYHDPARARPGDTASRTAAHLMPPGGLASWVARLGRLVRPGGTVTFIHRPQALPELLAAMDQVLGAIHVLPLCPRAGQAAARVLVRGTRARATCLRLLAPIPLHEDDGSHTRQSDAVLRRARRLDLDRLAAGP